VLFGLGSAPCSVEHDGAGPNWLESTSQWAGSIALLRMSAVLLPLRQGLPFVAVGGFRPGVTASLSSQGATWMYGMARDGWEIFKAPRRPQNESSGDGVLPCGFPAPLKAAL